MNKLIAKISSIGSLSSVTTWTSVLSVAAAVAASVFHHNLAPFVAPAATVASGLVVAITLFAKHQYASAVAAAEAAVKSAHIRVGITPPAA